MCSDDLTAAINKLNSTLQTKSPIDVTVQISATMPWPVDYHERKHVFMWLPTTETISFEDFGTGTMQAQVWTNLGMPTGTKVLAPNTTTTIPIMIRCTDLSEP